MPSALRVAVRAALVAATTAACSDASKVVLRSNPHGCSASDECREAGSADVQAPSAPSLELGKCFGKNLDCVSDPQLTPYEPGPAATCTEEMRGNGSVVFRNATTKIDCADPPCTLSSSQLRTGADGALGVAGQLFVPSGEQAGVWLARFSPDGDLLYEAIGAFATPSRLGLPKFHFFAGADAALNAFVVELVGRFDGPRKASVLRFDAAGGAPVELTTIPNVVHTSVTVAPDGAFIANTQWWANGFDANHDFAAKELDLSRYDSRGRLLWNQIKLTRALELTSVTPIGFDAAGNVFVELSRETGNLVKLPNNVALTDVVHRIAKVDRDGNLKWLVEMPPTFAIDFALASNGSLYVLRQPLVHSDGGFELRPRVLERFDQSGRSAWVLPVASSSFDPSLVADADGNVILATTRGGPSSGDSAVVFHRISAAGNICSSFEAPMDFCSPSGDGSRYCSTPALQPGPDHSLYFATTDVVGRVAPP